LVLALKYRPKRFEDLVGQSQVTLTLKEALKKDRLSHAYLFSGLRGSGKTSMARIFSKALLCAEGPTANPCEVCENCKMANENRHPDIIELDGASNRKIDDVRELIEHTKYRPSTSKFKVFIIDEVHMLTKEAFNALLKTLEEPPDFIKFILATTDPLKLPATILSRTQNFKFTKVSKVDVMNHLINILNRENVDYDKDAIEIIARSGSGSLRDTLTLLDQAIVYSKDALNVETVTNMLGLVDPKFIEAILKDIENRDYKRIKERIRELENFEAEMVIDELIIYLKEETLKDDLYFKTILLDRFFKILSDAKVLLAMNADSSFVLTLTFFKMIEAYKVKDIDNLIEELEKSMQLKGRVAKPKPKSLSEPKIEIENKSQSQNSTFDNLKLKIREYDSKLGECFEQNIEFISFEGNILTWKSKAEGDCKNILKNSYSTISHLVKELFGIDTKIKLPYKKEELKKEKPQKEPPLDQSFEREKPLEQTPPEGSCIAKSLDINTAGEQENILDTDFVQKAKELFKVRAIKIKSKV